MTMEDHGAATNGPSPRRMFTIGHSNHPMEKFLSLLTMHRVEVLVDVRSRPYPRYATHFNPTELKAALKQAGIEYLFLGKELGGRPDGAEFYDAAGHVLYGRVAESPLFREGIARVIHGTTRFRVALMCSEEDPVHCHRRLLIGRVLAERGLVLDYIRGDGRVESEAEVAAANQPPEQAAGQLALFAVEEAPEWKSIQSVLPKKPPPSSSPS